MAGSFHTLRIARVTRETDDAVTWTLEPPPAEAAAFAFRPGQFLTLRAILDGREERRSYSICAGPGEALRIGIRRVEGGVFSTWATTVPQAGDTVEAMPPDGRFGIPGLPVLIPGTMPRAATAETGRVIAAFAAGSGITPILSVIRTVLDAEPGSRVFLFYGNRSTGHILFRQEIDDLKDRHLARLSVFHVLSREEQDIPVLNGHLDADRVRLLLRAVVPAAAIDHALVCGPQPMIEALPPVLREMGVPADRVHVERFTPAPADPSRPRATLAPTDGSAADTVTITVIHDGVTTRFPARADEAIIDAAIRAGRDLPWSCKGGMCCTCRGRVTEGKVEMAVNYSLEPWELDAGFVLTCQARALTRSVTVDYDAT